MKEEKSLEATLAEVAGTDQDAALKFMAALDKMNMKVIDKKIYEKLTEPRDFSIDNLEAEIQGFIREKIKRPSNLINFFPAKELASIIFDNFRVIKK